jgi:hypothetical protein
MGSSFYDPTSGPRKKWGEKQQLDGALKKIWIRLTEIKRILGEGEDGNRI